MFDDTRLHASAQAALDAAHLNTSLLQSLTAAGLTAAQIRAISDLVQHEIDQCVARTVDQACARLDSYQTSILKLIRWELTLRLRCGFLLLGALPVVIMWLMSG